MSKVHSVHEDIRVAGLCNDCDRCLELARRPLESLDRANLRRLWVQGPISRTDEVALGVLRSAWREASAVIALLDGIDDDVVSQ